MAGSTAVFTFHDSFQITDPSASFFVENRTLFPSGITVLNEEQNTLNFEDDQMDQDWDRFLDSEDPLLDPAIWAFCNEDDGDVTGNVQEAGHFGFIEEGCSNNGINDNRQENPGFGDQSMPLSVFLVQASQYNCVCCQILREITHTNGIYIKRLEIHGGFGVIIHAVLGMYDHNTCFPTQDLQVFDFHKESVVTVKRFLIQYFEWCKREGYIPTQDPLSAFYEALSVGLNQHDSTNDFLQLSPENPFHPIYCQNETLRQAEGGSNQGRFMKIPLSMQRERTRKLKLKDFVKYFHFPIGEAARRMNLCPTVVKKICRKHGVPRWPYRKIKSIERKISKLVKTVAETGDNEERGRAQEDVHKFNNELANIYQPFTT